MKGQRVGRQDGASLYEKFVEYPLPPPGKGRTADTLQLEGGVGWANPHEAMLVNNTVKGLGELRHTECSMSQ